MILLPRNPVISLSNGSILIKRLDSFVDDKCSDGDISSICEIVWLLVFVRER